jgi:hypothetical protein
MLRPCEAACVAMGSCLSIFGESRGDAALKACDTVEEGVGKWAPVFGERLISAALRGVAPPDVTDAGVTSAVLLGLEPSLRGAGEPLRSIEGDLGGTSGGDAELAVSTLRDGFAPGLRMGESGLPLLLS